MKKKVKEQLDNILSSIENECVSYGEITYLVCHKDDVLAYGVPTLGEWAGIPEDEWNEYH